MQVDKIVDSEVHIGAMGDEEVEDQVDPELHGEPAPEEFVQDADEEHELMEPTTQEAQAPKALMDPIKPTQLSNLV